MSSLFIESRCVFAGSLSLPNHFETPPKPDARKPPPRSPAVVLTLKIHTVFSTLLAKMALVFSDASAVQFKIPAATFAVDIDVKGFKKVLDKSTDAEALWIYGAFLGIRVYEPEFNSVYFDAPVKCGVSKVVPATQKKVDEFPVVSEALKGALVSAIEQMQKDKKITEKVLNKCTL